MWFESYIQNNVDAFKNKVSTIANALGIKIDYLMAVMAFESRINPAAVNPVSGATGLIQFMPATAQSLGTTAAALRAMTNVEQLDYVYQYLRPYSGRMNTLADVYFAVFFPVAIGKPDDWVLKTSSLTASKIAEQNPLFDLNKDNQITVGEVKQYWDNWLKKKV